MNMQPYRSSLARLVVLLGSFFLAALVNFTASGLLAEEPVAPPAITPEQEKFFEDKVRPILAARCWKCHGSEKQESGLRLDRRESFLAKTSYGEPSVVPGDPTKGMLLNAARRVGDLKMPPDGNPPVTAAELELLESWIKMGAPWPKSGITTATLTPVAQAARDRQDHWAYQKVERLAPPAVRNLAWRQTPLDSYILAKLEAAQLTPSPQADRRTLIRRATFDLIGLPPDPDVVADFVADESPDASVRMLDRLLASPHYGERWGRHWLDIARYGDTKGYAFAAERRYPFAYTYRDYVIGAFNADLPYDQFILEQLAADRLPQANQSAAEDPTGAGKKRLAALGFLTTGRKFNNHHDDIDDKIDVVARGLMGLTVGCARCHDHKFDAIPMDDYYSLYGVFASCHEPAELPLIGTPEQNDAFKQFEAELNKLRAAHDQYKNDRHAALIDVARSKTSDYLARVVAGKQEGLLGKLAFLTLKSDDLRPKIVDRWRDYLKVHSKPDHPVFGPWNELLAIEGDAVEVQDYAAKAAPVIERWLAAAEGTGAGQLNPLIKQALTVEKPTNKLDLARIYGQVLTAAYQKWKELGGNPEAEGKLSEPQRQIALLLVAKESPTSVPLDDANNIFNRAERNQLSELKKKVEAYQATSPHAPARAMVVAENGQPHNPRVFIRGNPGRPGKEVQRQFLLVVAGENRQPFRDGSGRLELAQQVISPENPLTRRVFVNRVWMWHFGEPLVSSPSDFGIRTTAPPQLALLEHLAATFLERDWSLKALHRELMLSATYQQSSDDRADCRAVDPENSLYWRMNRRRLEFELLRDAMLAAAGTLDHAMFGRPVELTQNPATRRRAVYGFVDRQDLPNLFRVFDFASPDQTNERRPRTTVPQQSLFLMNSPFLLEQATALASRAEVQAAATTEARVQALYRVVFARAASTDEIELAQQFISAAEQGMNPAVKLDAWQQYAQLLLLTNEVCFVD